MILYLYLSEMVADILIANQNLKLQQETLGKRLLELSELKHQVEHLDNSRDDLKEQLKEVVELLKKAPKEVAEELSEEDGLLTKILNLGKATQTKCVHQALKWYFTDDLQELTKQQFLAVLSTIRLLNLLLP